MEDPNKRKKFLEVISHLMNKTTDRGATEAEATAAAEKVQELLIKYNLSMAEVRNVNGPKSAVGGMRFNIGSYNWKRSLVTSVARTNLCEILWSQGHVILVGKEVNVRAVQQLSTFLIDQVERLAHRAVWAYRIEHGMDDSKAWKYSYMQGMADRVGRRLDETMAQQKEETATMALVVVTDTENREYIERVFPERTKAAVPVTTSQKGYRAGYKDGDKVDIGQKKITQKEQ